MTFKIFYKILLLELRLLLRNSQEWLYPLGFFVLIVSLFPITFTPDSILLNKFIPGYIWLAAFLSTTLSSETIFFGDIEDGYLDQIMLSNIPLTFFLMVKLLARWIISILPLIFLIPLIGALFHLSTMTLIILCGSLCIGSIVLLLINSLCAALTLGLRQQGILLGLLALPLITPILIFGVGAIQQFDAGFSIAGPLAFLAGLSILAITLLPFVIAIILKLGAAD